VVPDGGEPALCTVEQEDRVEPVMEPDTIGIGVKLPARVAAPQLTTAMTGIVSPSIVQSVRNGMKKPVPIPIAGELSNTSPIGLTSSLIARIVEAGMKNLAKIVRIHCDWTNPPKFCKTCGGWNEKPCSTGCGNKIRYHCEWQHPPNVCEDCKKKAKERRHSQEGASQRIESAIGWRNWSSDKRSRFHGYLARHYQVDKNYLSEGELSAIADEFEAQDGGRRW